ncbi:TonB-dependent receptor domain-containing protein [Lampropedia puyangensis]|nr:TonB-dependent receptor [Lampropedia puyangensis]
MARATCVPFAAVAAMGAAHAQNPYLDEVVVTANRTEQRMQDALADISVIDRTTIEQSGVTGVADLLARLPGVEISRNGGPGTTTSVFIRGTETRYTAVFIDGVRVDSQSTGGAPWEAIPLGMIDRIEVLRGPAAAVYGSDAIGGVVQIFTRKGQAGSHPFVAVGLGNQGTQDASAGLSGAANGWDYALSGGYERSDGFNARSDASVYGYNPDKDGFRRSSGQAKLGYQLNQQHRIQGSWMGSYLNSGYDASANQDDRNKHQMHAASLSWDADWSDQYRSTFSISDSSAVYETSPSVYRTDTGIRSYLLHNEFSLGDHRFTAALERREDRLENGAINRKRAQNALALGYGLTLGAHTVQANARYDDDSEFGGVTTGSLAYGVALSPQWKLHASAGKAFRAPTLYQRFSDYGVATLEPEKGRNVEAGVTFSQDAHWLSLTVFRNTVKNQITYSAPGPCVSTFGCYENTSKARYEGVTLAGQTRLAGVRLNGSIDWQDPKDVGTGNMLARRAKRHAQLGGEYNLAGFLLGAEMQTSSFRWDRAGSTAANNRLGGYTLWNLTASRALGDDWLLTARVNNVGDKNYEVARTYATAGRTLYVGLKWTPSK